jgi:hypothetical protein
MVYKSFSQKNEVSYVAGQACVGVDNFRNSLELSGILVVVAVTNGRRGLQNLDIGRAADACTHACKYLRRV